MRPLERCERLERRIRPLQAALRYRYTQQGIAVVRCAIEHLPAGTHDLVEFALAHQGTQVSGVCG